VAAVRERQHSSSPGRYRVLRIPPRIIQGVPHKQISSSLTCVVYGLEACDSVGRSRTNWCLMMRSFRLCCRRPLRFDHLHPTTTSRPFVSLAEWQKLIIDGGHAHRKHGSLHIFFCRSSLSQRPQRTPEHLRTPPRIPSSLHEYLKPPRRV
jgi:hypothetical protein